MYFWYIQSPFQGKSVHSAAIFEMPFGQLKQDQVLSKWMGESWNLKKLLIEITIKLHIQISNKIQNELPMNVVSYAQIAF